VPLNPIACAPAGVRSIIRPRTNGPRSFTLTTTDLPLPPEGPFYDFNRPGVKASEAIIANWWRQGMMGGVKVHYDGIVAFSQTDFTEDLKKITVPVLAFRAVDGKASQEQHAEDL
jgi:hypothetical protein